MEYIKSFYFINNETFNLFNVDFKFSNNFIDSLIKNRAKRLWKKREYLEREGKLPPSILINDEEILFEEYQQKKWDLPNIFESNPDKLAQIREGDLFKENKRCIFILYNKKKS